jgi:hypothetical protein
MKNEDALLDDLAPKKRVKRTKKKFHSTKGATLDIALRRQVAAELGEDEPTNKNERYVLLQKFGVVSPKIDRGVTKPSWMSIQEWKRKSNEWYQATKGMTVPQQQKRNNGFTKRPNRTTVRKTFGPRISQQRQTPKRFMDNTV